MKTITFLALILTSTLAHADSTQELVVLKAPKCICEQRPAGGTAWVFCARYYDSTVNQFKCTQDDNGGHGFRSLDDCRLAIASIPLCQ